MRRQAAARLRQEHRTARPARLRRPVGRIQSVRICASTRSIDPAGRPGQNPTRGLGARMLHCPRHAGARPAGAVIIGAHERRPLPDDRRGAGLPAGQPADGLPPHQGRQDSGRPDRPPVAVPARRTSTPGSTATAAATASRTPRAASDRRPACWSSTTSRSCAICSLVTLARADYDVDAAPDGATAIQMLRAAPYDLLITDLRCPAWTACPSSAKPDGNRHDCRSSSSPARRPKRSPSRRSTSGVNGYLTKPFGVERVLAVAARALGAATPVARLNA